MTDVNNTKQGKRECPYCKEKRLLSQFRAKKRKCRYCENESTKANQAKKKQEREFYSYF